MNLKKLLCFTIFTASVFPAFAFEPSKSTSDFADSVRMESVSGNPIEFECTAIGKDIRLYISDIDIRVGEFAANLSVDQGQPANLNLGARRVYKHSDGRAYIMIKKSEMPFMVASKKAEIRYSDGFSFEGERLIMTGDRGKRPEKGLVVIDIPPAKHHLVNSYCSV